MVGCLRMTPFKRDLKPEALAALWEMTNSSKPNWWKDLLTHWAPSGLASGNVREPKLRAAVRNGYLNFYWCGQAIAEVRMEGREPRLKTHVRYAFGLPGKQAHTKITASSSTLTDPTGQASSREYEGPATLRHWITNAEKKVGAEKRSIDQVIGVNPSVVDVEMAISDGRALRIDLVDLEEVGGGYRIALWEGKLYSDGRLRSIGDDPKIKEQLERYSAYCSDQKNQQDIIEAYQKSCRILGTLAEMARACGNADARLDASILAVADGSALLDLDPMPRLLIFDGEKDSKPIARVSGWEPHRAKLTRNGITIKECKDWKLR